MAELEFFVRAIVEIAGSPKAFVDRTMSMLLERMEKEDSFEIESKKRFKVEEHDKVFSTFTELELLFKGFDDVLDFCFRYMPSHIEIERPPMLELRREELAELLNELLLKLHKIDMLLKDVKARHKLVEGANKILIKNLLATTLKEGALQPDELSKLTGIKIPNLMTILDFYETKGLVRKTGNKYELVK